MAEQENIQQSAQQGEAFELPSDGRMVLRTENLVKKYGKRTVVSHVSINVKQGEIVGLLGPNGAGKTTSFYMTTGLIVPNEGHIYLNNHDITSYPVYKRAQNGIGYLAHMGLTPFIWPEFQRSWCPPGSCIWDCGRDP